MEEKDKCVCCGKDSHEPKNKDIELRSCYIEGVGQVCLFCDGVLKNKK